MTADPIPQRPEQDEAVRLPLQQALDEYRAAVRIFREVKTGRYLEDAREVLDAASERLDAALATPPPVPGSWIDSDGNRWAPHTPPPVPAAPCDPNDPACQGWGEFCPKHYHAGAVPAARCGVCGHDQDPTGLPKDGTK